jgi:hypothetical protein
LGGGDHWPLFGGVVVVVVVLVLPLAPIEPEVPDVPEVPLAGGGVVPVAPGGCSPAGGVVVAGGVAGVVVSAGAPVVPPVVPLVPEAPLGAVAAGSVVVVVVLVGSVFLHAANAPAMRAAISRIFGALLSAFIVYSSFTSILCRWFQVRRWNGNGARLVPPWLGGQGSRTDREPAQNAAPFSARIRL